MTQHSLNMLLDPCLTFRVESARNGRVTVVVDPVAADDPPFRLELREGETWIYTLRLDSKGFGQENRIVREQGALPAPERERKGIAAHFGRRR